MALEAHTYGRTCLFYTGSNPFTRRASELSDIAPKLKAHFFYNSALPIDDPLSPIPPPSTASSAAASKVPPQPFSLYDNAVLEEAWQRLLRPGYKSKALKDATKEEIGSHFKEGLWANDVVGSTIGTKSNVVKPSTMDVKSGLSTARPVNRVGKAAPEIPSIEVKDLSSSSSDNDDQSPTENPISADKADKPSSNELDNDPRKKDRDLFRPVGNQWEERPGTPEDGGSQIGPAQQSAKANNTQYGSSPADHDTTGTPFLRAPSRDEQASSHIKSGPPGQVDGTDATSEEERSTSQSSKQVFERFRTDYSGSYVSASEPSSRQESHLYGPSFQRNEKKIEKIEKASVPVGLSRLHLVEMPELQVGILHSC